MASLPPAVPDAAPGAAPWRLAIERALEAHRAAGVGPAPFVALATVGDEGRPAGRLLVFRGFLDPGDRLRFVTDTRSAKAAQVARDPWGEACWYFAQTREQLRLAGPLTLVGDEASDPVLVRARLEAWRALGHETRQSFAWPTPGAPRAGPDAFRPRPLDPGQPPLASFGLLLLEPVAVDHLELRGAPQNRWLYRREDPSVWSVQAVNP